MVTDEHLALGDTRNLLLARHQEIAKWGDGWWMTQGTLSVCFRYSLFRYYDAHTLVADERKAQAEQCLKSARRTALSVYCALVVLHNSIAVPFYIAGWIIVDFLWDRMCLYGLLYGLDFEPRR
jgi:hypothetical protein